MRTLDDAALCRTERSALDAALAADPALAGEVQVIAGQLEAVARRAFWRELARECPRQERPAAAVLIALERAAGG
jgi:hypothetical protein